MNAAIYAGAPIVHREFARTGYSAASTRFFFPRAGDLRASTSFRNCPV
jgi:hypothetical protein